MTRKPFQYLLLAGFLMTLAFSSANAQEYILEKFVIGGGGVVQEVNSEGLEMSGLTGQLAIETLGTEGSNLNLYQGFWVPDGQEVISVENPPQAPLAGELTNYPNPLSNFTTVKFTLPGTAYVTLSIYDVNGRLVKVLAEGIMTEGMHQVSWDVKNERGTDVTSGSYMLELSVQPSQMAGPGFDAYAQRSIMIVNK